MQDMTTDEIECMLNEAMIGRLSMGLDRLSFPFFSNRGMLRIARKLGLDRLKPCAGFFVAPASTKWPPSSPRGYGDRPSRRHLQPHRVLLVIRASNPCASEARRL